MKGRAASERESVLTNRGVDVFYAASVALYRGDTQAVNGGRL